MPQPLPTAFDPLIDSWDISRGQRALQTQFGDGYLQRATQGVNPLIEEHTIALFAPTQTLTDQLIAFLDARGMVDAIVMTLPGSAIARNYLQVAPYKITPYGNGAFMFTIYVKWIPL